ncbi:hypothetical protein ATHL_02595 [Anaerolinea thermolimosa]|uniref:hypothetical protein n=1 Tax=Anaerolinea thermolimosa TaxID=229919 RepID=UPI00078634E7|nr:hypothetical protein [Anaerolinea thermolimosa]GAP07708.1 hypothetical protein ATHL_02595 [Anaerolinea thermolimosa]
MNYGEVLSRAWQIIWKYKVLWIFGILAGLGSGGGGSSGGGGGSGVNYRFDGSQFRPPFDTSQYFLQRLEIWIENNWWVFIVLAVLALVFLAVVIVLSTFGRIGLARGTWQADEGKEKLTFGGLFAESSAYFWRVLGLNILIFLAWIVLVLALVVPSTMIAALTAGIALICLGPLLILLCCLLIPVGWAVSVIVEQAIVAITCENRSLIDGLKRGWEIFRANLGPAAIMFLILGIGGGIARFIIALPFFFTLMPLIGAALIDGERAWMTGGIITLVLFCLYLPVEIVLNGIVTTYTGASWTLTFRRLTGRQAATTAVEVIPAAE